MPGMQDAEEIKSLLLMSRIQDNNIVLFSPWLSRCEALRCRGASKFGCDVGYDSQAAILIRQVGNGSDGNKNGGIVKWAEYMYTVCFKETIKYCSLDLCDGNLDFKQVKNVENQGLQYRIFKFMCLKNCLTNEYYEKMDFPQEKIFIAYALVKNKIGKMCLF